jgi:hypothetical protein
LSVSSYITILSDNGRKRSLFYYLWPLKGANVLLFGVSGDKWNFGDNTYISRILVGKKIICLVNKRYKQWEKEMRFVVNNDCHLVLFSSSLVKKL